MIITRGDTVVKKFRYLDRDGNETTLTENGLIKFTVKDKIDGTQLFQKIITNSNYDSEEHCYSFIIEPTDTKNVNLDSMEKVDYKYDYELNDTTNNMDAIITLDKGIFTITYDITTE